MDRELIIKLICLGVKKKSIAEQLSVDRKTLYRYLQKNPITEDERGTYIKNSTKSVPSLKGKQDKEKSNILTDEDLNKFLKG